MDLIKNIMIYINELKLENKGIEYTISKVGQDYIVSLSKNKDTCKGVVDFTNYKKIIKEMYYELL